MHGLGVIQNRHSAPPRLQLHCQRAVCVALSRGCDCPAESPERMPRDLLDDMGDIPSPRDLIHDRLIVLTTSLESRLDRLDRSISQVLAMASYIQHHINSFQLTPIDPIAQMPHKPQPAPPAPSPQTECDSPNDCEFPNCTCETIETVDTLEAAGIIEPSRAEEIDVDAAENAVEHNSNTLPGSDSRPIKDWKEMRGPYAKVHDQSDAVSTGVMTDGAREFLRAVLSTLKPETPAATGGRPTPQFNTGNTGSGGAGGAPTPIVELFNSASRTEQARVLAVNAIHDYRWSKDDLITTQITGEYGTNQGLTPRTARQLGEAVIDRLIEEKLLP